MKSGPRACLATIALLAGAAAGAPLPTTGELAELSLDQLANLEITSVSKKGERLAEAPASVFVITGDEIRRAGATSLAEALRLAPNLQVAQGHAASYAIRARGMSANSANKLLVLIDGRSVYSPLFSGVFWDVQDVMLEDVDRIEVISGPGATLWGVNAVNGVINVITKPAKATQGGLVATRAGNRGSETAARYGASAGSDANFRVYAKYMDLAHTSTASGGPVDDGAYKSQAGFRADWSRPRDELTVHGNAYRGKFGQPLPGAISIGGVALALAPIPVSGANLATTWSHRLAGGSTTVLEAYYDRTERTVPPTFADTQDIFDLRFRHAMELASIYSLVWGGEYRYGIDRAANSAVFAFLPARLNQRWASVFAQGEAKLRDNLELTLGARMERNDYTGNEFLPSARLGWMVSPDHLLWSAISRTVRAPSRLDADAFVPGKPPFLLDGGPNVRSEVAQVYEVGYRGHPSPRLTFSITAFHADYDHMHTQEIAPSRTFLVFSSLMEGKANGVEMWGTWQATDAWRVAAGYTAQRQSLRLKPGSNDAAATASAAVDPAHTWLVRSSLNISANVDFDLTARGVAALDNPAVSAYATADLRLAWRPRPGWELALLARNVADGGHGELTPIATRTEIGRAFYATLRWDYDTR